MTESLSDKGNGEVQEEVIPLKDDANTVCSVTGLSAREKQALIHSWNCLVKYGIQEAANSLLVWMFTNVEGMRDKFDQFRVVRIETLQNDENFMAHALAIMLTLEAMVHLIDKPARLERKITETVTAHVTREKHPVGSFYFRQLRDKFHGFIEQERVVPSDDEEVVAWNKLLTAMVTVAEKLEKNKARRNFCCTLL